MTENELRRQVCYMAQSMLGRNEADGSHRSIIDLYNEIRPRPRGYKLSYTDAWCAGFVSAVGQVCQLTDILFPECSCPKMIEMYKANGRWMEDDAYLPALCDLVFYDWQDDGQGDNVGQADHVGLVTDVNGDQITVTEGNMSHKVGTRQLKRNGRYIRGYGLPDYAAAAAALSAGEDPADEPAEDTPAVSVPDTPADTVTLPALPKGWNYVPLPDLQIGDGCDESDGLREAVRALQLLLKGRGFPVGWMGCDGEFGTRTESALGKYQLDRQLQRDGVAGPETWRKIICE